MGAARIMVFVNMKREAERVEAYLEANGVHAKASSGDVPQKKRLRMLMQFQSGELPVLIGTDVASRGLHIPDVQYVINYDLPQDAEDYVHRIGRTGRAGRTGSAFTLAASEDDKKYLHAIETLIGKSIELDEAEKSGSTAPVNVKADVKADSQSDKDSAGKSRSRNKKSGKKQAVNENDRTGNEKAAAAWR